MTGKEPTPFRIFDEDNGKSPFLLVSDHAGQAIPPCLGDLGLPLEERKRHIGWDIGIDGVGQELVKLLGTVLIEQYYSRLVIDCNRVPFHPTSIVKVSDGTKVQGNLRLTEDDIAWRHKNILHAYQDCIAKYIKKRFKEGRRLSLISLHSFTPRLRENAGQSRPWDVGILYYRDNRLSEIMMDLLKEEGLTVGDNQPYALTDKSDYTIPLQAEKNGIPYLEIEIRQDHLMTEKSQKEWGHFFAKMLPKAWHEFCRKYRTNG